jgi:small subunit ribosomal protein S18e
MPLEVTDPAAFRDMVRLLSTNVEGPKPLYLALTAIGGLGRRFAHAVARRAGLDPLRRAGTLTPNDEERIVAIIQNPVEHGIPVWMLNRRFDRATGKDVQWSVEDRRGHVHNKPEEPTGPRLRLRGFCSLSLPPIRPIALPGRSSHGRFLRDR